MSTSVLVKVARSGVGLVSRNYRGGVLVHGECNYGCTGYGVLEQVVVLVVAGGASCGRWGVSHYQKIFDSMVQ